VEEVLLVVAGPELEVAHVDRVVTPEKIFNERAARVYSLARRLLGNAADAEVFLQLSRKLSTYPRQCCVSDLAVPR
jgi:hypothetical protein